VAVLVVKTGLKTGLIFAEAVKLDFSSSHLYFLPISFLEMEKMTK